MEEVEEKWKIYYFDVNYGFVVVIWRKVDKPLILYSSYNGFRIKSEKKWSE